MTEISFGNLDQVLANVNPAANVDSWKAELREAEQNGIKFSDEDLADIYDPEGLRVQNYLRSTGPIADAYILSTAPFSVINGPIGSAKTSASVKKALFSAQRILPVNAKTGFRDYKLGVVCNSYDQLWKVAIPSWFTIFPKTIFPQWTGASPRSAQHVIEFEDDFGRIRLTAEFVAFGEQVTEDDLRGLQWADVWFPETDTQREVIVVNARGRTGRAPTPAVMGRLGRAWGDCNAPDVTSYIYRDFFEDPKPGHALFRQPSGLDPKAENLQNLDPPNTKIPGEYYRAKAAENEHKPDYVRRMIKNIPGVTRGERLVYDNYDDERNCSPHTLAVYKDLPVVVGIDNELSPAAVYCQFTADGQMRTLAEIALQGATIEQLGAHMLRLEATERFDGCEFSDHCDPAMLAGEDADDIAAEAGQRPKSQRERLSKVLGRRVKPAHTNDPSERREAVHSKIGMTLSNGRPGYILDPSCRGLRRGKQQTFAFRLVQGTDDLGQVKKSFDSHVSEAEQYAGLQAGEAHARKRKTMIDRERARKARERQEKAKKRYNPLSRRRA